MTAANANVPVKVAFDASCLDPRYNYHGTQVYARNLLRGLRRSAQQYGMEIMPLISPGQSSDNVFEDAAGFHPRSTQLLRFDRLWRYGGSSVAAFLHGADIMLNPNGASLPVSILLPTVTTIHDMTPMVMPCFPPRITFFLRFLLSRSAKSSAAIITVSEHSKRDIVRLCGVPESKVHVVYEGYDRALFNTVRPDATSLQAVMMRLGIDRPYILHHGAIQPRKNLCRLIAAYRTVLARNKQMDFDLVLAGPRAWQFEETVVAAQDVKVGRGRVVLAGPLCDQDLSLLLRGAELEVIPSLYEGFCLPMVEAMACGVPTIASNTSCLPEISGRTLRYFDPYSVEELAVCMEGALRSHDLRAELAGRGNERAQRFSWELCAEETLGVLEQVADSLHVRSRAAGAAL